MTERLYYTDSTLREFNARIVDRADGERGPAVQLDRTAFYPTSGGQPHDTGKLNDVSVLDVWEDECGEVWHLVDRAPAGDEVRGEIDWDRRFDHMQQHSGQHLLSGAFVRVIDAPTISFHLGTDESHIDLNVADISWEQASLVEADVNRVIWENHPVEIHVLDESELHKVPLRRPPQVTGKIRVVWMRDCDAAACGGTHVSETGAVGLVKITRLEHYKGGMRAGFLCGWRALRHYQRVLRGVQQVSADLSVHQDELGDAVGRLQEEQREARRELRAVQGQLAAVEAMQLWERAMEQGDERKVIAFLKDRSFEQALAVAAHLSGLPRTLALLAVSEAKGTRLVCQRSEDLPEVDAVSVLRSAMDPLGGRGGGRPDLAQGGSGPHPPQVIEEALRSAVGEE
ncbi:MAG: alanyl-tRNA editing protein [Gemmatimonadota bacterium]|nr:MAG: alanyl-tRNA editing protein [Gemmatimonadota bacterium]